MTFSFEQERMTAVDPQGTVMGYVLFPRIRADLVNICQVTVLPDFRGQKLEEDMMEALLDHLSRQNRKAALTCGFAQQYVAEHSQWRHILPGTIHFENH